jgi:hypothetical protein
VSLVTEKLGCCNNSVYALGKQEIMKYSAHPSLIKSILPLKSLQLHEKSGISVSLKRRWDVLYVCFPFFSKVIKHFGICMKLQTGIKWK